MVRYSHLSAPITGSSRLRKETLPSDASSNIEARVPSRVEVGGFLKDVRISGFGLCRACRICRKVDRSVLGLGASRAKGS